MSGIEILIFITIPTIRKIGKNPYLDFYSSSCTYKYSAIGPLEDHLCKVYEGRY